MLKINNKLNKYRIPLITSFIVLGGFFLYQYLTFIPEYSSAAPISTDTPVTITPTTPLAKWDDLKYMQQMSPEACSSATESTVSTGNTYQKQLIDVRDGKTYWVARIGNDCWMTQNLDYDDPGGIKRGDENSPSGWQNDNSLRQYWDPGYKIRVNGTSTSLTNSTEALAKDTSSNASAHYLQGNYYSWLSAMAGVTTAGAQGVCPDGWQLPTGSNTITAKDFRMLTNTLGATSGTSNGNSDAKLIDSPAYFTRGGYLYSGSLNYAGSDGVYWSSTLNGSDNAYSLYFNSSDVSPANDISERYGGFSVRCVAQTTSSETPVDPSAGGSTGINDPNVSVVVPNIITINVSSNVDIATEASKVNTGTFTTTVSSNKDYTISLNATTNDTDATSLVNYKDGNKVGEIKTIEGNDQPEAGKSGWGIRVCTGLEIGSCTSDYLGLPVKGETNSFVNGTKGVNQHMFQIGIGIGSELPSGTYSTSIQVTAAQK